MIHLYPLDYPLAPTAWSDILGLCVLLVVFTVVMVLANPKEKDQ